MNSFLHHLILLKCAIKEIVWVLQLTLLAVVKSNHSEIFISLAILLSKTPSNVIDRGVVISVLWEITYDRYQSPCEHKSKFDLRVYSCSRKHRSLAFQLLCIVLKSGALFTFASILVFRWSFPLTRDHPGSKAAKYYFPSSHFLATRLMVMRWLKQELFCSFYGRGNHYAEI